MSREEDKAIVRRYFEEVWARADQASVDELVHPDITVTYPIMDTPVHGREALQQTLAVVQRCWPDAQITADELIAEGDKVAVRWTCTGTQRSAFGPIPPTGMRVRWTGLSICRLADGKVIEDRGEEDMYGLMKQQGIVPGPQQVATSS